MSGVRVLRRVAVISALLAARASLAAEHYRGEVSVAAGVYRTSASQELGGFEQLGNLRRGILATSWGALDLRAAYCPWARLCAGGVVSALSGPVDGRAALALGYRAEITVDLLRGRFTPFVSLTGGGLTLISADDLLGRDTDPTAGWSAGVKLAVGRAWQLRAGMTHLITDAQADGAVAHNFAFFAGIGRRFGARHDEPPVPPLDGDGDGIPRGADRCPDAPEDPDGFSDADGCPDEDDDGDGIPDQSDLCPRRAGPAPRGCPPARRPGRGDGQEAR